MTDLKDGESVEMKGSAATPYVIRNTGGVYSCSCPAWRNQSIAIEQRTCKHIRKLRGDEAENERVGSAPPQKPVKKSSLGDDEASSGPPILLAESWDNSQDLAGWWMSEKLDGVRAYWDGGQFLSRQGNIYHAPDWFLEGLPDVPLDGELWIDRKAFQKTVSIVRRQDKNDQWKQVRYLVFDAPALSGKFEERLEFLQDGVSSWKNSFLTLHQQNLCRDVAHLRAELQRIESLGGEGLMLREPGSAYAVGRSSTLLKVKTFHDAEATVVAHEAGRGKHQGRLGALVVQLPNGKQFSVGTGFSDREREKPPTVGSLIQFRFQELSDAGIPRFPSYVGLRTDVDTTQETATAPQMTLQPIRVTAKSPATANPSSGKTRKSARESGTVHSASTSVSPVPVSEAPSTAIGARRFELVEGGSSKFWEISVSGTDVTTRWGRIGSDGQSKTKSFPGNDKAQSEYHKLIREKTDKGYKEVGGSSVASSLQLSGRPEDQNQDADQESSDGDSSSRDESVLSDFMERLTSVFETSDQPGTDALGAILESLNHDLDDCDDDMMDADLPVSAAPHIRSLQLIITDAAPFQQTESVALLTKQIRKAGFGLIGDFTVATLPICMRAFLRGNDTLAVISELPPLLWVELVALNRDETVEMWSNVPVHDGLTPPWSSFTRQPDADFNQLHAMMVEQRSDNEPGHIESSEFASYFEKSVERSMEWRASLGAGSTDRQVQIEEEEAKASWTAATSRLDRADSLNPRSGAMVISEEHMAIVQQYRKAIRQVRNGRTKSTAPKELDEGRKILAMSPRDHVEVLKVILSLGEQSDLEPLREALLKKRLPLSREEITFFCERLRDSARNGYDKPLIGAIEKWAGSAKLPREAADLLHEAVARGRADYWQSEFETLKTRVEKLANSGEGADERPLRIPIAATEVWAVAAIHDLEQMEPTRRRQWTQLLQCCAEASSAKASDKWICTVQPLLASISCDELFSYLSRWFQLTEKPQSENPGARQRYFQPLAISEVNQLILRGLVWCMALVKHDDSPRLLGQLAKTMYRTVPGQGPRSQKVGNASVFALGQMSQMEAVSQLAILKIKVRNGTAQRFIEGELKKAAERLSMPREDLEEMSVPTYGLETVGERRDELGDFTALLNVGPQGDTELRWLRSDGTSQKSVPASLEGEYADEVRDLKSAAKDIQKMVGVQRDRIDSLALQRKSWTLAAWRERYLDHPLVGLIARRLLWNFETASGELTGCCQNGEMVGLDDQPLKGLSGTTNVSLWHPIGHSSDEITQWRNWLEQHSITQPFKQAHREIYLLTDAERRTDVYSNRFAAHILKQTQLRALVQARGWHARLLGYWDGGSETQIYRYLPHWNITAQFWIQGIEPEGQDYGDTAGMPYVTSDQVRFYSGEHKEYATAEDVMPLERVPELVLSEIMRDVDLFVGVSSIGNDPNWQDGGVQQFGQYWHSYSFGELSESASTRREALRRIVPRLKIAGRCTFEDKFLVVKGDLRTYRIHFGSGNIQMEPNNQYLCIVPKPTGESTVFLPFEGDRTLSIILSKAFLLADDQKIKDATILSQIHTR